MRRRQTTNRDRNHGEIVAALEAIGVGVFDLASVGGGCPDILCAKQGRWYLVEIKDDAQYPSDRRLRPSQVKFQTWAVAFDCTVHVVTNVHEAIAIFQESRP